MKKLFFILMTLLFVASCDRVNKLTVEEAASDSTVVDSTTVDSLK